MWCDHIHIQEQQVPSPLCGRSGLQVCEQSPVSCLETLSLALNATKFTRPIICTNTSWRTTQGMQHHKAVWSSDKTPEHQFALETRV
jgi:hypothetical protein